MRPTVSVIVPTRNRAHLLGRALDSVFAQEGAGELFELEVIVVSDCSTDDTSAVISRYPVAGYLEYTAPRGPSAARNAGIAASAGAFVAFQDDDDLWLPAKLRSLIPPLLERQDVGVAYGQYYKFENGRRELVPNLAHAPSGWVFRAMVGEEWHFNILNVVIRRRALDRVGYFDEGVAFSEDMDLLFRLAFQFPFTFVPGPVAVYRRSNSGLSSITVREYEEVFRTVLERAVARLSDGEADARARERAWTRYEAGLVSHLAWAGAFGRAHTHLRHILARPGAVNPRVLLSAVGALARGLARKGEEPRLALQHLSREVAAGTAGPSLARRLVAEVWAKGAVGLAGRSRPDRALVLQAILRAMLRYPVRVWSKEILAAIVQTVLPQRHGPLTSARRLD